MHNRRSTQNWGRDLAAVQSKELTFDAFLSRHSGFIRHLAVRWLGSCSPIMQFDDVQQEIRIAIDDAIRRWDPSRGLSVIGYVRRRVRYRMLRLGEVHSRRMEKEPCLVSQQIVEECVMYIPGANKSDDDERYVAVTLPNAEELYDARRRAELAIGSLPAKQATLITNLLVDLLEAETPLELAKRYREMRTKYPRKATLRAITAALTVMGLSTPRDELEPWIENGPDRKDPDEHEEGQFLRPLRNVREPDSAQRWQSATAS